MFAKTISLTERASSETSRVGPVRIGRAFRTSARWAIPRSAAALGCFFLGALFAPIVAASEEPTSFDALGAEYERAVWPLLEHFCLDCHSTVLKEGELDLERFAGFGSVRLEPKI